MKLRVTELLVLWLLPTHCLHTGLTPHQQSFHHLLKLKTISKTLSLYFKKDILNRKKKKGNEPLSLSPGLCAKMEEATQSHIVVHWHPCACLWHLPHLPHHAHTNTHIRYNKIKAKVHTTHSNRINNLGTGQESNQMDLMVESPWPQWLSKTAPPALPPAAQVASLLMQVPLGGCSLLWQVFHGLGMANILGSSS